MNIVLRPWGEHRDAEHGMLRADRLTRQQPAHVHVHPTILSAQRRIARRRVEALLHWMLNDTANSLGHAPRTSQSDRFGVFMICEHTSRCVHLDGVNLGLQVPTLSVARVFSEPPECVSPATFLASCSIAEPGMPGPQKPVRVTRTSLQIVDSTNVYLSRAHARTLPRTPTASYRARRTRSRVLPPPRCGDHDEAWSWAGTGHGPLVSCASGSQSNRSRSPWGGSRTPTSPSRARERARSRIPPAPPQTPTTSSRAHARAREA